MEFSNFSTEDHKKRSQPASNQCPPPTCLPSNYTAALIRLTDDCSIRKSRGSPPSYRNFRGAKPPLNLFHRDWSPPCLPFSTAPDLNKGHLYPIKDPHNNILKPQHSLSFKLKQKRMADPNLWSAKLIQ